MSLINDMLRDLSEKQTSRQAGDDLAIDDVQTASWEQEKIANFFYYSRLPLILGSLTLFVALYLILQVVTEKFYFVDVSFSNKNKTPVEIEQPITIVEKPQELYVNQSTQVAENSINNNQVQIYQLIDQASRAMTLDRLTSPEHDNAYFYYQELLKLDPTNVIALSGIQKISDRYLHIAGKAIQNNHFRKAEIYITKASMINPDDARISEFQNQILSQDNDATLTTHKESVNVDDPFQKSLSSPAIAIANSVIVGSATTQEENHLQSITVNSNSQSVHDANLTIVPNSEFLDEKTVKQAREMVGQGFRFKAIELLKNHIQLYPSPFSEQYLLDIYYQDKNLTAMQDLLNTNLKMAQVDQIYFRARTSILQGDNNSAISLLESQLSNAGVHENYRALLAGLYQREQFYPQAVTAYRNLLQNFEPQPAYWLGLALSLDAQEQVQAAVHAYTQLLSFAQLEPQVRGYAQKRIAELTR